MTTLVITSDASVLMHGTENSEWLTVGDMPPTHLVVDGSNIATEGRSLPSLRQLDEGVRAFLKERPHETWTVVVDATFGHRIDTSEKLMYEEALAANEMVTPPAGTIGRGDKFLLEIADRANATVFSNDSFQEFHGDYEWLFDSGRLIGGKPIPEVGWIFTERTPVRGPKSRMASRAAERRGRSAPAPAGRRSKRSAPRAEPLVASRPPIPTRPPPRPQATTTPPAPASPTPSRGPGGARRRSSSPEPVNEPLPFIEFIAEYGPGSIVEGEVVSFTSHGAFIQVGDVRCYLALKSMGEPAPRSAREVLNRGEVRTFVVQALDAPRRGIDLALPGFADVEPLAPADGAETAEPPVLTPEAPPATARRSRRATPRRAAVAGAETQAEQAATLVDGSTATVADAAAGEASEDRAPGGRAPRKASARKASTKKASAEATTEMPADDAPAAEEPAVTKAPARKATAKKATAKKAAKKAPAKKAAKEKVTARKALAEKAAKEKVTARKAPAKKAAKEKVTARKAPAEKAAKEKVTARKAPAEQAPAEQAPAEKAPAERATAKKAPAEKAPAEKAPAEKAPAEKATAKKAPARKTAAKKAARKAPAKKATAKKATAKKAPAEKAAAKKATAKSGDGS